MATILDNVEIQLGNEPLVETQQRKPIRPNPLAPWELRIGTLRVCYDVDEDPEPVVSVRAVGVKERNRVPIGKQVIQL